MEQTNKDKLKFKIARGINALSDETIEYRKEAIIELFRVFDATNLIDEERASGILRNNEPIQRMFISSFTWCKDTEIKKENYWNELHNKLISNHI